MLRRSAFLQCILIAAATVLFSSVAVAQSPAPDFNSGITPYQGYHGGDIDSINTATGSVNLHIPLISFPQRGGVLQLPFVINYNSTMVKRVKVGSGSGAYYQWGPVDTNPFSVEVIDDQSYGLYNAAVCYPNPPCQTYYYYRAVTGPDGAQHLMGYVTKNPTTSTETITLRAMDMTGLYLVITDPLNPTSTYTIYDKSGIGYTLSSTQIAKREDPNGNYITLNQNPGGLYADTVGRSFGPPPKESSTGTDPSGCTGPLPIIKAVLWQVPGYTGTTYPIKFCYVTLIINIAGDGDCGPPPGDCGEDGFADAGPVLQSIVLPDAQTLSFSSGTPTVWEFEYNDTDSTGQYGTLTKVTLPSGGSISYTYQVYGDANDKQRAVSTRTVSDGTNAHVWTYSYTLPTTAPWTGITVVTAPRQDYDSVGNDVVHSIIEANPSDFSSAFEYQADYYQGSHTSGTKLRTVNKSITYYWNPYYTGSPSIAGFGPKRAGQLLNNETTTTLPNGQQSQTAYTYDGGFMVNNNGGQQCCRFYYGLRKLVQDYDYGLSLLRSTGTTYAYENNGNYLIYNIIDKVALQTISDGLGHLAASTSMGYDQFGLQTSSATQGRDSSPPNGATRGNGTSVSKCSAIVSNSCSTSITTTYTFYNDGNAYQKVDPQYVDGQTGSANQPVTTFQYNYQATYLTQTTLPTTQKYGGGTVNHVVSAGYDLNTGLIVHFTDQNSQTTNYGYDYSRRPTSFTYPDGGQRSATYNDSPPNPSLTVSTLINSTIGSTSREVIFDGLGRTIKSALTSDPEGTNYADTKYDAVGNIYSVSNPYRSTGEPTYGVTTYRYDGLKRKTLEIPADGSASSDNVQTTYNSNQVTVQDEAGKSRKMQYDALGRLIYAWEAGTAYKTDYQYDALSNLTQVQQEGGTGDQSQWRTRNFIYDPLSRLTRSYNPESGYRYFKYVRTDGANCSPQTASVCQRTDAIGNVTTYTFDALARSYQTSYSVQSPTVSTPSVTNYYDQTSYNGLTITYGTGRRTGMADNSGSGVTAWSYDQIGRTAQERKTITGVTLPISYQYNLDGSLNQLTYPDAMVEMYNYSTAGRELSVVDSSGSHNYGKNATYSAAGGLVSLLMANSAGYAGTTLTQSYNKRLQLGVTSAATPTQTIFSLTNDFQLGVTDNGNVWNITNNLDSTRSQAFTYDSLNRLLTAGTASTWGDSYVYDPWGNLYQMNVTRGSGQNLQQTIDTNNRVVG